MTKTMTGNVSEVAMPEAQPICPWTELELVNELDKFIILAGGEPTSQLFEQERFLGRFNFQVALRELRERGLEKQSDLNRRATALRVRFSRCSDAAERQRLKGEFNALHKEFKACASTTPSEALVTWAWEKWGLLVREHRRITLDEFEKKRLKALASKNPTAAAAAAAVAAGGSTGIDGTERELELVPLPADDNDRAAPGQASTELEDLFSSENFDALF